MKRLFTLFVIVCALVGNAWGARKLYFEYQVIEDPTLTDGYYQQPLMWIWDDASTGDDGKTGFKDLTPGIYEIFESDPPDGYIITGDAKFYIKVDSLGVHLLVKKVQNGRVTFEGANTSRVGNVTLSTTDTAITFTVENTPGTELPAAGGSGTLLYSVLGAILIVFAGAALVVRMKRG